MSKTAKAVIQNMAQLAAGKVPAGDAHLKRFLFVLLVDVSGSTGAPFKGNPADIDAINEAIPLIFKAVREPRPGSPLAKVSKQIDLSVVAYSSRARDVLGWTLATQLPASLSPLTPEGGTSTGAALEQALQMIHTRQTELRAAKTPIGMPHIIHLTDGAPTDMSPGDALWTKMQSRLARIGGQQGLESIKTAALVHLVTPNGCDPEFPGNLMFATPGGSRTGLDRLAALSGATSVHPLPDGLKMTDTLVEVVTATIINVSVHNMSPDAAAKAAVNKPKEGGNDKTVID